MNERKKSNRPGVAIWLCVVTASLALYRSCSERPWSRQKDISNTFPSTTVCNLFSACLFWGLNRFTTTDGRTDTYRRFTLCRCSEDSRGASQYSIPPFTWYQLLIFKCMSDRQSVEIWCQLFHCIPHPLFPKPSQGPILPSSIHLTFQTVYRFHVRIVTVLQLETLI
jgi:hypothetical protein